ncbi:MAG: hypothetical protein LQ339_004433 [Xanthoria mediterranea]|nr:MAG: hypothetical protein LQ339_004433 [Xanthoria mediterranea]
MDLNPMDLDTMDLNTMDLDTMDLDTMDLDTMDLDTMRVDAELVSTRQHEIQITDHGWNDDAILTETVENSWPSQWRNDIHWIGKHGNEEIAVVHLAYGNETTPEWHYSTAPMIVKVPDKHSKRRRALTVAGRAR